MNTPPTVIGIDEGAGAIKIVTAAGSTQLPAHIAHDGHPQLSHIAGLETREPPLHIETAAGSFYVGPDAHDWGRPVENLDHSRFTGSPEMAALLYGALTRHTETYGALPHLSAVVGLPQQAQSEEIIQGVKAWLPGDHAWQAQNGRLPPAAQQVVQKRLATHTKDALLVRAAQGGLTLPRSWSKAQLIAGMLAHPALASSLAGDMLPLPYHVHIAEVQVTSQPVGAWLDFLLDMEGGFIAARKPLYAQEIGVISIGMATVELLVVQQGKASPRFTRGETEGVQRLLALANPRGHYSRGEMDTRLRRGALAVELPTLLPVWWADINGLINQVWENTWERFGAVVIVGGGAILLGDFLRRKFREKAHIPEEPVMAVARGLYKFGVMRSRRQ